MQRSAHNRPNDAAVEVLSTPMYLHLIINWWFGAHLFSILPVPPSSRLYDRLNLKGGAFTEVAHSQAAVVKSS